MSATRICENTANILSCCSSKEIYTLARQTKYQNILCDDFYSMWWLEGITFCKSLLLILCFFKHHVVAFLDINVLKEVCILLYLHNNITNTIFQNKAVLNYAS